MGEGSRYQSGGVSMATRPNRRTGDTCKQVRGRASLPLPFVMARKKDMCTHLFRTVGSAYCWLHLLFNCGSPNAKSPPCPSTEVLYNTREMSDGGALVFCTAAVGPVSTTQPRMGACPRWQPWCALQLISTLQAAVSLVELWVVL